MGQAPRGQRDRTRAQRGNKTQTHVHCCRACVQGRGYHEAGSIAERGGGCRKKKHPQAQPESEQHRTRRRRGNSTEQAKQMRGQGWHQKEDWRRQGAGPGGRAPNKSRKKHTTHTKGGGKSDPFWAHETVPGQMKIQLASPEWLPTAWWGVNTGRWDKGTGQRTVCC